VVRLIQAYPWPGNIRQLANVLRTAAVMASGDSTITREHLSDDFLEDAERHLAAEPSQRSEAASPHTSPLSVHTPPAASATPLFSSAGLPPQAPPTAPTPNKTLEQVELDMIRQAVEAAGGNISEASKRLGISRNTIYRKLRWNQPG
jgi:transcriptional regulator of acetoin/glycerol metabolism